MYEYNICNWADAELFHEQCLALQKHICELKVVEFLEDVDGTLLQVYQHPTCKKKACTDGQRK